MNNEIHVFYPSGKWRYSYEPLLSDKYVLFKGVANWDEASIDRLVIEELYPIARNFFNDEENV